jgi:hypothetical protein
VSVLVAVVVLAWVAILLLGLAVGGLLAQVRTLAARPAMPGAVLPSVVPRIESPDVADLTSGAFSAVFVEGRCKACHHAVPELLAKMNGGTVLIVSDELPAEWTPLPPGARAVIDAGATARSHIPAVPWFAAVDADGRTVESFALGNSQSVQRAALIARETSAAATGRQHGN